MDIQEIFSDIYKSCTRQSRVLYL